MIATEKKGKYSKTFLENAGRFAKAATIPAIGFLGLNYLGVHVGIDQLNATFNNINEVASRGIPFTTGLAAGIAKNFLLVNSTLKNLQGKTHDGDHLHKRKEADGTYVFRIKCVDNRRVNKNGGAMPGSFGILGAEFINLAEAAVIAGTAPANVFSDFATGYFIGGNLITTMYSHMSLFREIGEIARSPEYKGHRLKIEMKDHWKGCGAQGFTNIASYWLKFKAHKLTLADFVALPNEAASYIYVNGILAPAIGLLSRGRISLSAVSKHTYMK